MFHWRAITLIPTLSDGLWDFVSNEEAVDIALKSASPDIAATGLRDLATHLWTAEEGFAADDITVRHPEQAF